MTPFCVSVGGGSHIRRMEEDVTFTTPRFPGGALGAEIERSST